MLLFTPNDRATQKKPSLEKNRWTGIETTVFIYSARF